MSYPKGGQALALQGRIAPCDPLALYSALTDGGRRKETLLLERSSGSTLLMDRAALRAECRGSIVTLTALSKVGETALGDLTRRLSRRLIQRSAGEARLCFPRPEGHDTDSRLMSPSPIDVLRELSTGFESLSGEEPFTTACLGISTFDQVDLFEDLPANPQDPLGFPDFIYWLAESLIVFEPDAEPRLVCTMLGSDDEKQSQEAYSDAARRLADLKARCSTDPAISFGDAPALGQPPEDAEVDLDDSAYCDVVLKLREHIIRGDVYQIVPSRTFSAPCRDPIATYHALRAADPSPYQFFASTPDHVLFGASPETSVRVFRDQGWKKVEVKPIAGTRPRGATGEEDARLEADMRLDDKELAEHMMLVDLARNDVARVSIAGTRQVSSLMTVERYARVMHLVSSVTGVLAIGLDAVHAMQACLNVGTLTGAPKHRATELLRQTELTKRGPYGGAIGWLNGEGLMDSAVIIRTAVVQHGTAFVRTGAGIVYDSDPQREADETRRKASALLSVLGGGEAPE